VWNVSKTIEKYLGVTKYFLGLKTEKHKQTRKLLFLHLIVLKKPIVQLYYKNAVGHACHLAMIR